MFFRSRIALLFILTTGIATPVLAQAPIQSIQHTTAIASRIDAHFGDITKPGSPGASVAVVLRGETVYVNGFGEANLEYGIPITPRTVFHVASLSKQVTAFAALLLQEDGLLHLDDDVRTYIPELPDFGATITLRHLATHASGLRDQWRLLELAGWRLDDVITTQQILSLVGRQRELNFLPGHEHVYSNTGFTLLAEVVARVSGMSFAEYTRTRIFEPLGMESTHFHDDHTRIVRGRADSYARENGTYRKAVLNFANVGATSLQTTAGDFALWAGNFSRPVVGSKSIIDELNSTPPWHTGGGEGYALGQFKGTWQGIDVFVHGASDAGYRAYFARIPAFDLSIVVMANTSGITPINDVFAIAGMYLSEYLEDGAQNDERSVFEHDPGMFVEISREEMEAYTGDYWEPVEGYRRQILVRNDTLFYHRSPTSETPLRPVGPATFKMIGDSKDVTVRFNSDEQDRARMQVIIDDNPPLDMVAMTRVVPSDYEGTYYSPELGAVYALTASDDGLVAKHLRLEGIDLSPVANNLYASRNRNFARVDFLRNEADVVTGMRVSSNGARNVLFVRTASEAVDELADL